MNVFIAAAWAGVISLDFIGFGPFMISQPIVCGPLFGALLGQTAVGLLIGAIAQLLWMDVTPVGVGIPYDATSSTLLAIYLASQVSHPSLSQIVLALVIAVPFGLLFRWIDIYARRLNTQIMRRLEGQSDERLPGALTAGVAAGLGLIFMRYFACYAAAFWCGQQLWNRLAYAPRLTLVDQGLTMAAILLPLAGLGVCLELMMSDDPRNRWDPWKPFRPARRKEDAR